MAPACRGLQCKVPTGVRRSCRAFSANAEAPVFPDSLVAADQADCYCLSASLTNDEDEKLNYKSKRFQS